MHNFLNRSRQEALLSDFVMILTILFWVLNTVLLLNNYFLSIADSIITDNKHVNTANSMNYLSSNFEKRFTKMNWHYASTYEIEKNNKILKIKKFMWVWWNFK